MTAIWYKIIPENRAFRKTNGKYNNVGFLTEKQQTIDIATYFEWIKWKLLLLSQDLIKSGL